MKQHPVLPRHIAIRYSDKFGTTIELHNQVAQDRGLVWFGKMGTRLAASWIDVFQKQLAADVDTYVYLVKRDTSQYVMHKGKLLQISRQPPEPGSGLPKYYFDNDLIKNMSCFFQLECLVACTKNEMMRLKLQSSGGTLLETLSSSMNGLFIVINP